MKIGIYNHETGEQIERDMTDEELVEFQAFVQNNQEAEEARLADIEAKATQRQAILDRLGLTEEEAKLLLG